MKQFISKLIFLSYFETELLSFLFHNSGFVSIVLINMTFLLIEAYQSNLFVPCFVNQCQIFITKLCIFFIRKTTVWHTNGFVMVYKQLTLFGSYVWNILTFFSLFWWSSMYLTELSKNLSSL